MLILSRKTDESIMIGDRIEISVIEIRGDQVKLGIKAPRDVKVYRQEVYDAIQRENIAAAQTHAELPELESMFEDGTMEETDKGWVITGNKCKGWNLTQRILASGVKEPFTCPIMNSMNAALDKMGVSTKMSIAPVPETQGTRFTLTKV